MAYDFASDLETIFNTDEIAEDAAYIRAGFPAVTIPVIFEDPFVAIQGLGDAGVGGTVPVARCKTTDVANASRGDTLKIDDVTYYVQEVQPDGRPGVTLLILSKDP